jgi:LCP family protein required for cell wall assembly
VEAANARLERLDPKAVLALTGQGGLPLRTPTNVLVLGADRTGRADSMQILHADGGENLVSTLAIPRDLRLAIPGHGERKLNEAYALGGPALAIQTVQQLTGLPIHHVVVVDFNGFRDLIDAVGGIEVTSSQRIRSTFDGITFNFVKGRNELNGRRALAYARVRKNELNTADSDVSRGVRQAQVIAALKDELISPSTILRLRGVGEQLASPLATDLSANEILTLGWVDFRAQR